MKKTIIMAGAVLIGGALISLSLAQEGQPAPAQAGPAVAEAAAADKPAVSVNKKTSKKGSAKKAKAKQPAVKAAAAPAAPEPAPAPAAEVTPPQAEAAAPVLAAVSEPVKPAAPAPSACPHCFQPLPAGYAGILADINPWMEEMNVQAVALDQKLSAIQKQINEKESAIESARLGTDKKAMKEAVKNLNRERKLLLKEYTAASGEKDAFYEKFSKEVEKRTEGYNRTIEAKLRETLAAASQ